MKILVVVDTQVDFINGTLGTKEAQAIVPNVVDKIKNHDGIIIGTKDTHYENYLETGEGKKLPVVHCVKGTPGHDFDPAIEKALDNKNVYAIVEKPTFGSLELIEKVKEIINTTGADNIEEITLIGLCTDICVISNALLLKANFYEIPICVDASCCAGVTPTSHEEALRTMGMCQINIL